MFTDKTWRGQLKNDGGVKQVLRDRTLAFYSDASLNYSVR